jgi:hypothetical protein
MRRTWDWNMHHPEYEVVFFFKKVENLPPIVANCMAKSKDKPQEFEVLIVWTKP